MISVNWLMWAQILYWQFCLCKSFDILRVCAWTRQTTTTSPTSTLSSTIMWTSTLRPTPLISSTFKLEQTWKVFVASAVKVFVFGRNQFCYFSTFARFDNISVWRFWISEARARSSLVTFFKNWIIWSVCQLKIMIRLVDVLVGFSKWCWGSKIRAAVDSSWHRLPPLIHFCTISSP